MWIVWWALMILIMVPFAGRLWCGVCPIPAPGEWLQRRALVQPRPGGKLYTLGKKWPQGSATSGCKMPVSWAWRSFQRHLDHAHGHRAGVARFMIVAIATSLVFERRTFCRYLCPVGGFIGLYSQVAPVEVRVKNHDVCASTKTRRATWAATKVMVAPGWSSPAR